MSFKIRAVFAIVAVSTLCLVFADAAPSAEAHSGASVTVSVKPICQNGLAAGSSKLQGVVGGDYTFTGKGFAASATDIVQFIGRDQYDAFAKTTSTGTFRTKAELPGYLTIPNQKYDVTDQGETRVLYGPKALAAPSCATKLTIGHSAKIKSGHPILIHTRLTFSGHTGNIVKKKVALMYRLKSRHAFEVYKTLETSTDGTASVTTKPRAFTQFYWAFAGAKTYKASKSDVQTVTVG